MSERPGKDFLVSGNATKAGLPEKERLAHINAVISEASKDSRFNLAQERKAAQLDDRIRELGRKVDTADSAAIKKAQRMVKDKFEVWMAEKQALYQSQEKVCFVCVDMDAFFAACETLRDPSLASVPMAVGNWSMLSTANYEARKYGVSAGMPGYLALKLCPQLKLVPIDFDLYRAKSAQVTQVLSKYDPSMLMFSLDEAFLKLHSNNNDADGVDHETYFGDVVQKMRREVFEATGLTCSAGLALSARLAKMASNVNKPNGQFLISLTDSALADEFWFRQPVRKVPGIGKVRTTMLEGVFNVHNCADLWNVRNSLPLAFKEKTLDFLLQCSIGHEPHGCSYFDVDDAEGAGQQKSISCERTFKSVLISDAYILKLIPTLVENVYEDAIVSGIKGFRGIGIKVKSADFQISTRERSLSQVCTLSEEDRHTVAKEIDELVREFAEEKGKSYEVRLFGVRLSRLMANIEPGSITGGSSATLDSWISKSPASAQKVHCPICDKVIAESENEQLSINFHIDQCLSAPKPIPRSLPRKRTALDLFLTKDK